MAVYNAKESTIKVGNPLALAMPCVTIDIEKERKTFYIASVSYHHSCNNEQNLPQGLNGTVLMMKLALILAKTLFPLFKKIELQDTSGYHDSEAGFNVVLSDRQLFFTGATWYSEHLKILHLAPASEDDRNHLSMCLALLASYPSDEDKKSLKKKGFNVSTRLTILENLIKQKEKIGGKAYLDVRTTMRHYKLPSLEGITWIGKMLEPNPFGISFEFEKIAQPSDVKAQWGGWLERKNEHLMNNVGPFSRYAPSLPTPS